MNFISGFKIITKCSDAVLFQTNFKVKELKEPASLSWQWLYRNQPKIALTPRTIAVAPSSPSQIIPSRSASCKEHFEELCEPLARLKIEDRMIRQEISDPFSILRIKIIPPPYQKKQDCVLPNTKEEEFVEPESVGILEKRAARLIVIRRAKMKKHKWRKLQKRMKFEFAKKRQKRELKKEKAFQALLLSKIKEAEQWNAEDYVVSRLKTAAWERPITRLRGFYAPESIIREYLSEEEEKRKIAERIKECIKLKSSW